MSEPKHTNRLIHAASPYLQQHAHNPVDWYAWGEEALQRAKTENKPIFLSIGYSACHWCHVMEHESFENEETARIMNEHFINIKVDREERPDLDEIYMSAVQLMTGSGGWPMSVFLTPELKPFYGSTYFPPRDRYGRPGFVTVLMNLTHAYENRREEIDEAADRLTDQIRTMASLSAGTGELSYLPIEDAVREMKRRFDSRFGGFGGAPKFPHSMDLSLLLRHYHNTADADALKIAEFTLEKMARGGMYDQIGGGFHRYSTDDRWLIPHFEKMLYDNALLAKTYLEAYQLAKKPFYREITNSILDYVLREMTSPDGGFFSTQDADSAEGEGIFFAWTPKQIAEVIGNEKAEIVCRFYGVEERGNFEHGLSALHIDEEMESIAAEFNISTNELKQIVREANEKLFAARETRIKPGRDEKILTDWNGLMISAMACAGNALDQKEYIHAAERACDFLIRHLCPNNRLLHTYKDGRAHTNGFLSDYAFLIGGLLDAYEAAHTARWLQEAIRLTEVMIEQFWDEENGAFFFTGADHEKLIARTKDPMDNATPSGNSIAILDLLRLAEMTGNLEYRARAEQSFRAFISSIQRFPGAFAQMLSALDFLLAKPKEIVLAGKDAESLRPFQQAIFREFDPHKVVLYVYDEEMASLSAMAPIVEGKKPLDGSPACYICRDFRCRQPVTTVEAMMAQLRE
ncbi:MAG: thioredoxin domain-containing protein [Candidatus Omnitrophota bacterium]|jgi:uncharacterized protein YyaL (SSP411 family)|nr:MAG: thioredoxin domain-containing protein [Candidatus Omnitrophota bacterium]